MLKSDSFSSPPNGSTGPAAFSPRRNRSKNLGNGTSAGKRSPRPLSNSQSLHHLLRNQVQSVIARFVFDFYALFANIFLFLSSFFPPQFSFFPSIIFSSFGSFHSLFFLSWLLPSLFLSYLPPVIRYSFNVMYVLFNLFLRSTNILIFYLELVCYGFQLYESDHFSIRNILPVCMMRQQRHGAGGKKNRGHVDHYMNLF